MREAFLYIFDEIHGLDDGFPEWAAPLLSVERRIKTFYYRFPLDRKLSVAVYLLLRLALMEKHGIDELVAFAYGENGKPFLRDHSHIHFNLSHCGCAAACVISDGEVGVDVQEIAPVSDGLAQRVLTAKEYAGYKASPHPDELFCEIWTMKESLLKRTSRGIAADLTALAADDMTDGALFKCVGYRCCVSGASVRLRRISAHDFDILS
jgi:4'-phosphopantetheinyl transferase